MYEIVCFTCTTMTFNIGIVFLIREDEETYTWVLEQVNMLFGSAVSEAIVTNRELGLVKALGGVFPYVQHLLCWVHILRCCKDKAFDVTKDLTIKDRFKSDYRGLFMSLSEEIYVQHRRIGFARWPALMSYVDKVWLQPYKENIVKAWTDKVLHLRTRTTNR